ncbi:hypothetical protein [Planctobacterium marinum]|uniref:hypothetical protein n=1 Tax=Planctobacterium marinum TaxID=1631968 RepID=UPI001E498119|nr:hypothetical protein [Planctobacterium marinum]MCC2607973.1 hypothetical protein [Planctobacterium marinum]
MSNSPRPKSGANAPKMNAPRPPNSSGAGPNAPTMNAPRPPGGPNGLTADTMKRLNAHIGQGRTTIHTRSEARMHEERAYIYDRMSKGAVMTAALNAKTKISPFSTLKGADRDSLTKEAMALKPFKHDMKANNPEGARAEKVGKTAKYTKTGAGVVSAVGTGVTLVNPLAGGITKAAATGVGIGAGIVAATAYDRASKAYGKNVNDNASGDAMFASHIAAAKSDLNKEKRNNMIASTMLSGAFSGVGQLNAELMSGASEGVRMAAKAIHNTAKGTSSYLTKEAMDKSEGRHKSEIVNLMMHQRSRQHDKPGLMMPPKATVIGAPPDLQRQNATRNVNTGAGPQLQRQNASRPLKGT